MKKYQYILAATLSAALLLSSCSLIPQELLSGREQYDESIYGHPVSYPIEINGEWSVEDKRYYHALLGRNLEAVKECIEEEGADPSMVMGWNTLSLSVMGDWTGVGQKRPYPELVNYLLDKGADPNGYSPKNGYSFLMRLTPNGISYPKTEAVLFRNALEKGADPNRVCFEGMNALDYAAYESNYWNVQAALEYGAIPRAKTIEILLEHKNWPKFHKTAQLLLEKLLEEGGKSKLPSILEKAILEQDEQVQSILKKSGCAKLSRTEKDLLLRFTTTLGTPETMELLAENKIAWKEDDKQEALSAAAYGGNIPVWDYLITKIEMNDTLEDFTMECAFDAEQTAFIEYMLDHGASLTKPVDDYITYLYSAADGSGIGSVELVDLLLSRGYPYNENNALYEALQVACLDEQPELIRYFWDHGYDIRTPNGYTDLFDLGGSDNLEIIKILLEAGYDINGDDQDGTPLFYAADANDIDIPLYLIEKGADVNLHPQGQDTVLCKAVRMGYFEVVKALVEHGADVNAAPYGAPLLYASPSNHILTYLIEHGADVNQEGSTVYSSKTTPLVEAAQGYNVKGIQVLLDAGADPNYRDKFGKTPLDYAMENDWQPCIDVLEKVTTVGAAN